MNIVPWWNWEKLLVLHKGILTLHEKTGFFNISIRDKWKCGVYSHVENSAIYFGQLIANNFSKIYWNMSSLSQYETLCLYNITSFFNRNLFDLNSQYSLNFFAITCFFIYVNTSPIKYHTSNMIVVCFLKPKKKKEDKIKKHICLKSYLSKRREK